VLRRKCSLLDHYVRAELLCSFAVKEGNVCNPAREFTANAATVYSKTFGLNFEFPIIPKGREEVAVTPFSTSREVLCSNLSCDTTIMNEVSLVYFSSSMRMP
jgi:hypothetical protein